MLNQPHLQDFPRRQTMALFHNFAVAVLLLNRLHCLSGAVSNTQIPTVVVVINDLVVQYNNYLPLIFEKMQEYTDDAKKTPLMQFKTVVAKNETTAIEEVCFLLASGVFAFVDLSTPRLAPLFKSACQAYGIAYIALVDACYFNYPLQRDDTDAIIEPPATQMLMAIASIVQSNNLTNVAIVYDESFDIQNTPRRVLTNVPAQHIYIPISANETEVTARVEIIIKINIKSIFIIADKDKAKYFLALLLKNKQVNFDPHVFILTKDSTFSCETCLNSSRLLLITAEMIREARSSFIDFMRKSLHMSGFQPDRIKVDEALAYDVARLIINAVKNVTTAYGSIENIGNLDCYNISTLNDSSVQQSKLLIQALSQIPSLGVFGSVSWDSNENVIRYRMTLLIHEIKLVPGMQSSKTLVANWTKSDNIYVIVAPLIKSDTRKIYRVVTVQESPPFVFHERLANNTVVYTGYCIELLKKIAEKRNFDYTIYDVELVGNMDKKGQWSGAIAELIEGRADIAVGPISVMAERENVIDFTVPYYDLVGLTILMRKPTFDYSLVKFLSVLDEEVWGCIIGAFFLFSILITVFDKLSPFSYQNRRSQWKETGPEPKVFTFKEGIWFCMMSLTPQGGGETPKALSGRLIAATWWLFGFIIIATYTANLAAFLTVSRLETPIVSLDDLSKQYKIKYGPKENSTALLYFQRMADIELQFYEIWKNMSLNENMSAVDRAKLAVWDYPVSDKYTKLWETMKKSPFPETKSAAIKKVLEEDYAFIHDATSNRYETTINCDLMVVGEEFSRKPYALAVQEGSPLRADLSNTILELINSRELETLKTIWWKKNEKQCPTYEDESDGISIKNIGGVFLVIVIGSGLSLIMLAFECYWYRYRPQRRRKALTNASTRTQQSSTMTTPNANINLDSNVKSNTTHSGLTSLSGMDADSAPTASELSDNGVYDYTNNGYEQTERF